MMRAFLVLLMGSGLLTACSPEATVEEAVIPPADSVKVIAGYDVTHLQLTEDDLVYAPQKMTKHHLLGLSAVYCDTALMAQALAAGANPALQTEGMLPLFEAALCLDNGVTLLGMLLNHGAAIDRADHSGETALNYAIAEDRFDAVDFLLKNGASLTLTDEIEGYGCPPAYSVQTPEMVAFLQERGADFSAACASGMTLLHFAAENDNGRLIKYLLEQNLVDPRAQDDYGDTAFDYATNYAATEAQDLLRPFR